MVHCTGCHCEFTVTGYSLHVQRTRNSACTAAYNAHIEYMDNVDGHIEYVDNVDRVRSDVEVFSGDYFTNYQDNDFEWPEEEQAEGL